MIFGGNPAAPWGEEQRNITEEWISINRICRIFSKMVRKFIQQLIQNFKENYLCNLKKDRAILI